jgi:hypothetical protein
MKSFIDKHTEKISGSLSCFDRVIFKGYLPIRDGGAMEAFMGRQGLLLKNFKKSVMAWSEALKAHAKKMAEDFGRPLIHLTWETDKEAMARAMAERDSITQGLVCIFSRVEQCQSFKLVYGKKRPRIVRANPRCLCLYYYFLHRQFGLIHIRIQTWFPYVVQIYINGHEWLARKLDAHGIGYEKVENAFVHVDDLRRAQRFADRFEQLHWPRILSAFARKVNPHLKKLLYGMEYYWVTDQAEYATDILFKDRTSLKDLYQKLLRHSTVCFGAEDVMTFLGKKLNGNFRGEALNHFKTRWPGARIKHRMKANWIKMYDKHGCVLRIETVINHPYEFRIRRMGKRNGDLVLGWYPMAKGVANLYRYREVCLAANSRYLEALSVVDDPAKAYRLLNRVCEPVIRNGRRRRGLNPLRRDDVRLFAAALDGKNFVHGFRNRDLARNLGIPRARDPIERKRRSARVNRLLNLLHAHGLIAKIQRSHRYRLTVHGAAIMSAAVYLRKEDFPTALLANSA